MPDKPDKDKIHPIDVKQPDPALIRQAARIMQSGGVIVFPTTGLYGLGADATNGAAVDRIFHIKRRASTKPILVLIGNEGQLDRWVTVVPPNAENIMHRHWPGGVTLVFESKKHLPPNLTAGTGKIGIRLPAHPVAAALVDAVDFPVTATSANLAGQPGCVAIEEMPPQIINCVDFVLDAGRLSGGSASTVVDVTGEPVILREGRIAAADIVRS